MKVKLKLLHSKKPCWANITLHALTRFISRWEPSLSIEQAEDEMYDLLNSAKAVGKTPLGDTMYISGLRPDVRFVIKDNNVCVTVLPPGDTNFALLQSELEFLAFEEEQRQHSIQFEIDIIESEIKELNDVKTELLAPIEERLKEVSGKIHQAKNKLFVLKRKLQEGLAPSEQ